jgi:ribose 5-phosphate isomerase
MCIGGVIMASKYYAGPLWQAAGTWALRYMHDSDLIVLGTGRTVLALADIIAKDDMYKGKLIVPASDGTRRHLEKLTSDGYEISIGTADDLVGKKYDCFTGADEIVVPEDFNGDVRKAPPEEKMMLLKGADKHTGDPGIEGCISKESKIMEGADKLIIVADYRKVVPYLGYRCKLPVDVRPSIENWTSEYIGDVLHTKDVKLRMYRDKYTKNMVPFVTENGNHLYDAAFNGIKLRSVRDAMKSLKSHLGIDAIGISEREADVAIVAYKERNGRLRVYNYGSLTRIIDADQLKKLPCFHSRKASALPATSSSL